MGVVFIIQVKFVFVNAVFCFLVAILPSKNQFSTLVFLCKIAFDSNLKI
jgi:hypothetical protein